MAEKRKRIRPRKMTTIILIIALILSISLGAFISLLIYSKLNNEKSEIEAKLNASISENEMLKDKYADAYTKEETEEMVSTATETSFTEGKESVRNYIKDYMNTEDASTSELMRKLFPEYIVYRGLGGYVYEPINEDFEKIQVDTHAFIREEDGTLSYAPDGEKNCLKGIDVSQYQNKIDWEKVKDFGIDYAFIRVGIRGYGSGKLVLDSQFENNMMGVSENNIDAGVYFFTQAISEEEAKEEADFIIEAVEPYELKYPIVLDVERITNGDAARADAISKEDRTTYAIAFCEEIKANGYTPMIYGNMFTLFFMLDMTRLTEYDVWFAFYDDYLYYPYKIHTWQYTESLSIPGISTKVDGNITFINN